MSEDMQAQILRATDCELTCLMAGYLLQSDPQTIPDLYDRATDLVGEERLPTTKNAFRYHLSTSMNPAPALRAFVDLDYRARGSTWKLAPYGAELLVPVARFRLSQSIRQGVSLSNLFANRDDPSGALECLVAAHHGAKTVQEVSSEAGVSIRQASAVAAVMFKYELAEKCKIQNGKGMRLGLDCNGKLSRYVAQLIQPLREFLAHPADYRAHLAHESIRDEELRAAITHYEQETHTRWYAHARSDLTSSSGAATA
ncbi:MAG TPA: hypothetical protein VLJ21_01325 [Candidatus Binatia bacterium]|nr:hypothetical protein [Candidatus Binatia bacterium]